MEIQIRKMQIKSTRKMTTTQSFSEKTTETGGLELQHLRDAAQDDEDARTNTKARDGAKNQAELSSKPRFKMRNREINLSPKYVGGGQKTVSGPKTKIRAQFIKP
jgi:hypothetical protein